MCEVGSKLQVAFQVFRVLLHYSSPFKLDRDTKDVLPGQGDSVSPLAQLSSC